MSQEQPAQPLNKTGRNKEDESRAKTFFSLGLATIALALGLISLPYYAIWAKVLLGLSVFVCFGYAVLYWCRPKGPERVMKLLMSSERTEDDGAIIIGFNALAVAVASRGGKWPLLGGLLWFVSFCFILHLVLQRRKS